MDHRRPAVLQVCGRRPAWYAELGRGLPEVRARSVAGARRRALVAFARALELEELGADIVDIGAESTRPGSDR